MNFSLLKHTKHIMRLSLQHEDLSHLITHKGAATTESQGLAFVSSGRASAQQSLATYEPTA
jgi:hypothetical protein